MSTESRMKRLETIIAALASASGVDVDEVEVPRTTAKLGRRPQIASMASKGKRPAVKSKGGSKAHEDITIENVGGNRADGRMRLPARMFGSRDAVTVDGHKFVKLESDQNRSANFNPAVIGAEVGDDVTFIHEGGSKWTVEIASGSRKRKRPAAKAPAAKAKPSAKPQPKGVKVGTGKQALVKEAAKKFGLLARTNAAEDFQNENILEYSKFEDDPRQYLTSRENAQAKRIWKGKAGVTLAQWVEALSEEVYG